MANTAPPQIAFEPVRVRALRRIVSSGVVRHKLTTLVAPIGYGKTTVMGMVLAELRRSGRHAAWVTLGPRADTLDATVQSLLAQLQPEAPRAHPTEALLDGRTAPDQGIDALIRALNAHPVPVALFLDNIDHCTDPRLPRLIDRLCFDTPASIQIFASSTQDIAYNRSRAELEGVVLPLTAADLRFDAAEAGELFGAELARTLGAAGVDTVMARTEGWPAALRMIRIILERSSDTGATLAAISGSHQMLADLLNREILSRFVPHQRARLIELGLLHSFSEPLIHAIWPESRDDGLFETLLGGSVLLVALDPANTSFRFHTLLRDFLAAEALAHIPESRRAAIRTSAGQWHEQQGNWREAIEYAFAAGDAVWANRLLTDHAEEAVRDNGQTPQFLDWADALEQAGITLAAETEYWRIWALAFRRHYDAAKRRLTRLQARVEGEGAGDHRLLRPIHLLQASIESLTDNGSAAHREASAWLKGSRPDDDPFELCAAHCILTGTLTAESRFTEAREAIQSARLAASEASSPYVDGWVATYGNLIPVAEGNYTDAYAMLIGAITRLRGELADSAGICGALALVAARCAVEMNLEEEARGLLVAGLPHLRTHGFLDVAACGLAAAVALWDGTAASPYEPRALQAIADSYPPRLSRMLGGFVVRRLIELERIDEAAIAAARIGIVVNLETSGREAALPSPRGTNPALALAEADLVLSMCQPAVAAGLIEAGLARTRRQRRSADLVDWLLLKAQLAGDDHNPELAKGCLIEAIRIATHRRILRPFIARRRPLAPTLRDLCEEPATFSVAAERAFFAELIETMALDGPEGTPARLLEPQLFERLTPRELDMLRLVAVGMSNERIAARLGISITTVKWHLQNVFGKMDVRNRSAAVATARLLGLVG
ncbi:LuxR C-terminal-related transcriptional regulator [Novosphingobium colocasiae]|uniref:Transcriptional regulator n=1 Tax=Novosphingobium colocasiae TaxID=1256513 RepID=A0A918PF02_9SPHN|nr:LuxR C-terminal-related transcriptional regulator [Novosphingobium colocasiae]GGZ03432.1 transcriptional regulator [Novosphingobium colocasiae]